MSVIWVMLEEKVQKLKRAEHLQGYHYLQHFFTSFKNKNRVFYHEHSFTGASKCGLDENSPPINGRSSSCA
jgi:hypothetical protein